MDHNKLIAQAAKAVLEPMGLFRKGRSRVWIDDNGWFFTVVEFQPSGYSKGVHLNAAVNFLWSRADHLTYDFYDGTSSRTENFVSYDGDDDAFLDKMLSFANTAAERVMEYRKLKDFRTAKKCILPYKPKVIPALYDKVMLCGLTRSRWTKVYYRRLLKALEASSHDLRALREELFNEIAPVINDRELFQNYVLAKIRAQRTFWHAQPSMTAIVEEFYLEETW